MEEIKKEVLRLCNGYPEGLSIMKVHGLYQRTYGKPLCLGTTKRIPFPFLVRGERLEANRVAEMTEVELYTVHNGTTWMQEIVPLILSHGDPEVVDTVPNWDRVPWLEENRAHSLNLEQRPSPRVFNTHFQYDMMPTSFFKVKPRVIYVMRNPRDVFTSYFHFSGMASYLVNPGPQLNFSKEKLYSACGFDHVKGWLYAGEQQHIMYISYEEMILVLLETGRII